MKGTLRSAVLTALLGWVPLAAAGNYVRVDLPKQWQAELPSAWCVRQGDRHQPLASFVAAHPETPDYFDARQGDAFTAEVHDGDGQVRATLTLRFLPLAPLTQTDARTATGGVLVRWDDGARSEAEAEPGAGTVKTWSGTFKQVYNGATAVVSHYTRQPRGAPLQRVKLVRVFDLEKSFAVTLSYRDGDRYLLQPVTERILASLKPSNP